MFLLNRTQSNLEAESTVGNIVNYYNYSRPPLAPLGTRLAGSEDLLSPSPSVELGRVGGLGIELFQSPEDGNSYNAETRTLEDPMLAARTESPPSFAYEGRRLPAHVFGAPNLPIPPTPAAARDGSGPYRYHSEFTDLPTTDQTYGNTGQLLQLTPRGRDWPFTSPQSSISAPRPQHEQSRLVGIGQAFTPHDSHTALPTVTYDDEDKENTPPHPAFPDEDSPFSVPPTWSEVRSRVRGPPTVNNLAAYAMPRSSSYYPDDDSVWESTQSSHSRENLADHNAGRNASEEIRPSQDSYADTSVCGSNHRLSYPRVPPIPTPFCDSNGITRPHASSPYSARQDWRAVINSDEKLARKILEDKILEDTLLGEMGPITPRRDKVEYLNDMRELERLRKDNPSAVERAVNAVVDKLGKLSPLKPVYSPEYSFSKGKQLASGKNAHDSGCSETQGLLEGRCDSPYMSGGLQFSDTSNTFKTARRIPSMAMCPPVKAYSPLSPPPLTPPANALIRGRAGTNSTRVASLLTVPEPETPVTENIEMKNLRKKKHVSRVAMSSQTELRPLQLAESTRASASPGALTDAQLMEAEPGWTLEPDFSDNGPLARLTRRSSGPTAFLIQRADGGVERVSTLMRPQQARNLRTTHLQKQLTRPYFKACVIFPLSAAFFGLGCLDYKMVKMTDGAILEMSPSAKKQALTTYLPLGMIIYTAIGLMIALIVLISGK